MTSIVLKGYVSALTNQNQEGLHLALPPERSKGSGAGGTRTEKCARNFSLPHPRVRERQSHQPCIDAA